MWRYSRISKLAKIFTYKNHPSSNQNKACFSRLLGFKSPSVSSRYEYMTNHCPNSFCLVKHYHNSGVTSLQLLCLAHEVGHHVARHVANRNNMNELECCAEELFGLKLRLQLEVDDHQRPHGVSEWIQVYLFQFPNFRRQESEADDIGLLLMASAGYDPQLAPKLYERLVHLSPPGSDFYYPCPSGRKRAKKLARGKVMKEASSRYSKVIETRKMNDLKDR